MTMGSNSIDVPAVVMGIRCNAAFARGSGLTIIAVLTAIGVATAFIFVQFANGPMVSIGPNGVVGTATINVNGGGLD